MVGVLRDIPCVRHIDGCLFGVVVCFVVLLVEVD